MTTTLPKPNRPGWGYTGTELLAIIGDDPAVTIRLVRAHRTWVAINKPELLARADELVDSADRAHDSREWRRALLADAIVKIAPASQAEFLRRFLEA